MTGGSVSSFWRMYVWLSSPSSSQGPKPQQGDPAAPGPPCGPAAPHLQLPEGPPDGEGPAASAGGGRGLELPPPLARPEEGDQRGGQHPMGALCSSGRLAVLRVSENTSQGGKKTKQQKIWSFHLIWVWEWIMLGFMWIMSPTPVCSGWVSELLYCYTFPLWSTCIYSHCGTKHWSAVLFIPVFRITSIYLLMCVDILLYFFVLMHCSRPSYSLYRYPQPPRQNLGF